MNASETRGRSLGQTRSGALVALWAGLALAGGCAVGPNYRVPETSVPATWSASQPAETTATTQPADVAQWWKTLNDPLLDSLIARAARGNLDLRGAEARIREARALRSGATSGLWPQVNAAGSYAYKGTSLNAAPQAPTASSGRGSKWPSITVKPGQANAFGVPGPPTVTVTPAGASQGGGSQAGAAGGLPRAQNLFQAGFDAAWELDLFGGVSRSIEAADADVAAAQEDHRDVLVSLLSEVARNYVEARGSQQRIAVAHKNITAQQETLNLTRTRFSAGLTSELDVAQAQAQLATTWSQVPVLETQLKQAVHRIGVLLGEPPESLSAELAKATPLPAPPGDVPVGLPSDLLRRRPDIRRGERRLAAATARIGAATADLFPKFSLTGSFASQTHDIQYLLDHHSAVWSVGPAVRWPIFEGGRIRANIAVQTALADQALTQYQLTILTALEEAQNTMVAYRQEQVRQRHLTEAVQASRRAVDLANERYVRGLATFLSVLDSQRSLYSSEDQLIQSQSTTVASLIALYKALGGGWGE